MNTVLLLVLAILLFAVCAVREATPEARTPHQIGAMMRACGWRRATARTLQIAVVLTLLLLASSCRIGWATLLAASTGLALIAAGLSVLGERPEIGGAASA